MVVIIELLTRILRRLQKTRKVPVELLEAIGFKEVVIEIIIPTFDDRHSEGCKAFACVVGMVHSTFEEFFGGRFEHEKLRVFYILTGVFAEALANAAEHGNRRDKNKEIRILCWIGEGGVLFGIHDEGDFFKRHRTKRLVESRTPLLSSKEWGGGGMAVIYQADRILVQNGILYLLVLIGPLLAETHRE